MSNHGHLGPDRALDGTPGAAYDEEAFRYFLDIERARAGRTNKALGLLFATIEPAPGRPAPIPEDSVARLFEGLRSSLRETDVMGWYRQGRVAGAVLAARDGAARPDASDVIARRVGEGLRRQLPPKVARSLRVRIIQMTPRRIGNA